MHIKLQCRQSGFSLIELAVVLVVVGILAGAFLSTVASRIEATRRADAEKQMQTIKQALYGYAMSQTTPHLPCPAPTSSTNGVAALTCSSVTGTNMGFLPWATLGLGSGDSWGDRYMYWVATSAADSTTGIVLNTSPMADEAKIDTRVNGSKQTISSSAVAVIISLGKDGYGGTSVHNIANQPVPAANVDEQQNLSPYAASTTATFIARTPTKAGASTAGGEFDDILVWISEYELKAKMVESGKLP